MLPGEHRNSHGLSIRMVLAENRAAERWTLADLVVRLRCSRCSSKALTLHLTTGRTPDLYFGDGAGCWELLLHGEAPSATSPHA